MKRNVGKVIFGFIFCLLLTATATCAAEGMAFREERDAVLRQTECQAPQEARVQDVWLEAAPLSGLITSVSLEPGDYVRVVLVCAGGTGYEWKLTESKLTFLETVKSQVMPFPNSEKLAGGKVAYIFLYKAGAMAAGDDRLKFALLRAWEGVQKGTSYVDVNVHYNTDTSKYNF